MPPDIDIDSDDEEFDSQVGPHYEHNVDYDECPGP
jgi:hypothetical protein